MKGTATDKDLETHLTYFAEAPDLQRAASLSASSHHHFLQGVIAEQGGEQGGGAPPPPLPRKVRYEGAPHLPSNIGMHAFLIEMDLAMRFLVVGVYALVLLGAWGSRARVPMETFDCGKLVSFFADTLG